MSISNSLNRKTESSKEFFQQITEDSPNVLFIGAGPVGLWTAIQAKLKEPQLNITMLEKHQTYQRQHVLRLNRSSFEGVHQKVRDAFREFLDKPGTYFNIRTDVIEERLKKLAQQEGIQIVNSVFSSPAELVKTYANAQYIIGADGANSLVRKEVFNDKKKEDEVLQHTVLFKYTINGEGKTLDRLECLKLSSDIGSFVSEHVGKPLNGASSATLQLFVDKETSEAIAQDFNVKNPASLKNLLDHNNPKVQALGNKIQTWLEYKKVHYNEQMLNDSGRLNAVPLKRYAAEKFVKTLEHMLPSDKRKICWVLVGDSAMGVPFFRSLNLGLKAGTSLANDLAKAFNKKSGKPLRTYNRRMKKLRQQAMKSAKITSFFIEIIRALVSALHCIKSSQPGFCNQSKLQANFKNPR